MHFPRKTIALGALLAAFAASAQATDISLSTQNGQTDYGQWKTFNISDIDSLDFGTGWIDNNDSLSPSFGSPLSFTFSIAAGSVGRLTVVDAGFAGDTFTVTNFGTALGHTSAVPAGTYENPVDVGVDFNAALADPRFSQGVFTLGAGSYRISGLLDQSVTAAGQPLNSTVGALNLTVAAVPEPSTYATLLAGLGLLAFALRRRSN